MSESVIGIPTVTLREFAFNEFKGKSGSESPVGFGAYFSVFHGATIHGSDFSISEPVIFVSFTPSFFADRAHTMGRLFGIASARDWYISASHYQAHKWYGDNSTLLPDLMMHKKDFPDIDPASIRVFEKVEDRVRAKSWVADPKLKGQLLVILQCNHPLKSRETGV